MTEEKRDDTANCGITCNMCHYTQLFEETYDDTVMEFATFKVKWGFNSNKDLEAHLWHLCEHCYDNIVTMFAITPEIREYPIGLTHDPFDEPFAGF